MSKMLHVWKSYLRMKGKRMGGERGEGKRERREKYEKGGRSDKGDLRVVRTEQEQSKKGEE